VKRTQFSLLKYSDIISLNSSNPGLGKGGSSTYSVFDWRGGKNCKHFWVKYLYQPDTKSLVKSTDQPIQVTENGMVPGVKKN
jgi:hypothetical protein